MEKFIWCVIPQNIGRWKHIVQYDKNYVNEFWCGQQANNNKNMKGHWDKQHRGNTCSCRYKMAVIGQSDVNF
jgi:hypothetical protein